MRRPSALQCGLPRPVRRPCRARTRSAPLGQVHHVEVLGPLGVGEERDRAGRPARGRPAIRGGRSCGRAGASPRRRDPVDLPVPRAIGREVDLAAVAAPPRQRVDRGIGGQPARRASARGDDVEVLVAVHRLLVDELRTGGRGAGSMRDHDTARGSQQRAASRADPRCRFPLIARWYPRALWTRFPPSTVRVSPASPSAGSSRVRRGVAADRAARGGRARAWGGGGGGRDALAVALGGSIAYGAARASGAPAGRAWLDGPRLVLVAAGLLALGSVYQAVGGDGYEYYALLRSPVLDGDLDFANDFAGLGSRPVLSSRGEITSRVAMGVSLFWAPHFLLAHLLALAGLAPADGFGPLYQAAVTTASYVYAFAALLVMESLLRRRTSRAVALVVVLAIWLATPLHFYMTANPSMSHGVSVFAATAMVWLWLRVRESEDPRQWALVGLAGRPGRAGPAAGCRPARRPRARPGPAPRRAGASAAGRPADPARGPRPRPARAVVRHVRARIHGRGPRRRTSWPESSRTSWISCSRPATGC